jgi:hypothetical protein
MSMWRAATIVGAVLGVSVPLGAQDEAVSRQEALAPLMHDLASFHERLPRPIQVGLSGPAQSLFRMARSWDRPGSLRSPAVEPPVPLPPNGTTGLPPTLPPGRITDPTQDVLPNGKKNNYFGFVQASTATAWCGNSIVTVYADDGSLLESVAAGVGLSQNGYSLSTNAGATWHDMGFQSSGLNPTNLVAGLSIACGDANTFYIASEFFQGGTSLVGVAKSSDGGVVFDEPTVAVTAPAGAYFLDAPSVAVDPTNTLTLYVAYVVVDQSGTTCQNSQMKPATRTGIEIVKSTDGGATWAAPVEAMSVCDSAQLGVFVEGVQAAVDGGGIAHLAWESNAGREPDSLPKPGQILHRAFAGSTFAPGPNVVTTLTLPGDPSELLQGDLQVTFYPSLAVDRSGKATDRALYVAWTEGTRTVPDYSFFASTYTYSDIFVASSTDGGVSWSHSPGKVNTNLETTVSSDQFMPALAVDRNGVLGACWYDRRNDPANFLVDRYCGRSTNGGVTWTNSRITPTSFVVTTGQDAFSPSSFLENSDTLATDFLKMNLGFKGAYSDSSLGNPDLKLNSFF